MRQFSLNLAAVVKTPNSDGLKPTTVMKTGIVRRVTARFRGKVRG